MTGGDGVRAPKRARLYVTRIDPWSVTKVAFMLALAVGVALAPLRHHRPARRLFEAVHDKHHARGDGREAEEAVSLEEKRERKKEKGEAKKNDYSLFNLNVNNKKKLSPWKNLDTGLVGSTGPIRQTHPPGFKTLYASHTPL